MKISIPSKDWSEYQQDSSRPSSARSNSSSISTAATQSFKLFSRQSSSFSRLAWNLFAISFHITILFWYYSVRFQVDDKVSGFLSFLHRRNSFLTNITFLMTLLFFINRLFTKDSLSNNVMHFRLAKVSLFVALCYWTVYILYPEQVVRGGVMPFFMDAGFHGGNCLLLFAMYFKSKFDKRFQHPLNLMIPYYHTTKQEFIEGVLFAVIYGVIMLVHRIRFGFHVYPFMATMGGFQLVSLLLLSLVWSPLSGMLLRKTILLKN